MKAKGRVLIRGQGEATSQFDGTYLVADGGVWLDREGGTFGGAALASALGGEPGEGKWLFLPLSSIVACSTDDNPAE